MPTSRVPPPNMRVDRGTGSSTTRSTFPFLRRTARPSIVTPESSFLNDDILPLILSHLDQGDLLNCLLVGRAWLHPASRALYTNADVEYGREWENVIQNHRRRPIDVPRSVFQGVQKPALPHRQGRLVWPFGRRRRDAPLTPFQPSPMKVEFLRHVRALTYYCHPRNPCDSISLPNIFPSLETLTIIAHRLPCRPPTREEKKWGYADADHPIDWSSPLLTNLRPKHLRLLHIPSFHPERYSPYPIPSVFGNDSIERMTVHFLSCLTDRFGALPRRYHSGPLIQIDWPRSLRRLDVVFMQEDEPSYTELGAFRPVFYDKEVIHLRAAYVDDTAEAVAAFLASAVGDGEREIRIRLIGLGWDFFRLAGTARDKRTYDREMRERFGAKLRAEYVRRLMGSGLGREGAEKWADELELISMLEYVRGEDCSAPMERSKGIEGLEFGGGSRGSVGNHLGCAVRVNGAV